jgi:hypothetical protein
MDYYLCSVSTCNRKKIGLFFCSVPCWDAHLPTARHRDAWAESAKAPSRSEWEQQQAEQKSAAAIPVAAQEHRRVVGVQRSGAVTRQRTPEDILIVVSKLKQYVRARSEMNTSDGAFTVLSDHLRELCDRAIDHAASQERKTVMDRDFLAVLGRR